MMNPIQHIRKSLEKRRATKDLIERLEVLHIRESRTFPIEKLIQQGADIHAMGLHRRADTRVSALSLTVGHPWATAILLDAGARYDNSMASVLKHLVITGKHDLPMFSQTIRALNKDTIISVQLIMEAGESSKLDRGRFVEDMQQMCEDRTSLGHPVRPLVDIMSDNIPGFSSTWQRKTLSEQAPLIETVSRPKARL